MCPFRNEKRSNLKAGIPNTTLWNVAVKFSLRGFFDIIQCISFIMLCSGSIGMDRVISELGHFYKGIIGK